MVKFFRHIRKSLLQQNKMGKYFKYAIGEILLVVLGILIALQINNWNESRKNSQEEQQILKQLKSDYIANLTQLQEKVTMREESIKACHYLLGVIDGKTVLKDSDVYNNLWPLMKDPTFDPIKNDIIETDRLRLIQNDSLKRILSNWTSDVYQVQEMEIAYRDYRNLNIFPIFNKLGFSRNIAHELWKNGYLPIEALSKEFTTQFTVGKSKKKINLAKALQNAELEGILATTITYQEVTNIQSYALKKRIEKILALIESSLEN